MLSTPWPGSVPRGAFLLSPCAAAACAYAAVRPNPPALGAFAEGHPGHPLRTPHPPCVGTPQQEKPCGARKARRFTLRKQKKIRLLRYGFLKCRESYTPLRGYKPKKERRKKRNRPKPEKRNRRGTLPEQKGGGAGGGKEADRRHRKAGKE